VSTSAGECVLGLDFGPKHAGLAVVLRGPSADEVVFAGEVRLRALKALRSDRKTPLSERKTILGVRRALRRSRRSRKRYRQPKIPQRGGGATTDTPENTSAARGRPPEYRRATGLNTGRRRCKFTDPTTGEVCAVNTPRKTNVRDLLLWNICRHLPVSLAERAAFVSYVNQRNLQQGEVLDALPAADQAALQAVFAQQRKPKQEPLAARMRRLGVDRHLRSQITDIVGTTSRRPLSGRLSFCRQHFLRHHEQTRVARPSVWLPTTIEMKHADVLRVCGQEIAPRWQVRRIVLERAGFDLQLLRQQVSLEWRVEDWQRGPRWGYRNTFEAKKQDQGNRCAYCGKKPSRENRFELEHVAPGGGDSWENLVLSCRACNQRKGSRSPAEAGMLFWADTETGETLAPLSLGLSRVARYMTQTDQGWRRLEASLRRLFPGAEVEYTWGYQTSFYRNRWGLPKKHYADAAVIASSHQLERKLALPEQPKRFAPAPGGKRLFDTNPLAREPDGHFTQRQKLVSEQGGLTFAEVPRVENPRKRKLLQAAADKAIAEAAAKGEKPPAAFTAAMLAGLPFNSVRLTKPDAQERNTRQLGQQWFKVAGGPNVATILYEHNGNQATLVKRNPAIFRADPGLPRGARVLAVYRKGDFVECSDGLGRVTKNHSNGTLTVELVDTGKAVTRQAKSFRPARKPPRG